MSLVSNDNEFHSDIDLGKNELRKKIVLANGTVIVAYIVGMSVFMVRFLL